MSRSLVILGVVVACGVGALMLLNHPRSSTSADIAAPSSVATEQSAEPAADQEQSPGVAAEESVATRTGSVAAATTGIFRGRLIDAVTRQPVGQEFEVRLIRVQRGPEYRQEEPLTQTFQSDLGRFSWNDVPADTWSVTVSAHGYQRFELGEVTVAAGKRTREVVMPLFRGFAVRGRVVAAATGAGIPEAYITFRVANAWQNGRQNPYAKSNEDGSFLLDGVPAGDIALSVGARDFADTELEVVVDANTPPQEIALSTGGRIAGIVTTASGAQVSGRIVLDHSPSALDNRPASSQFSFDHVAAGHHVVFALTTAGTGKQEIVLGPGERREDIVVIIAEGHSVRGTVRGLRPEQLNNAFVSLRSEGNVAFFGSRIDEQGAYVVQGVPPGRARLHVFASGGDRRMEKTVDVPADRDLTLDLVFPAGARLSGRVTQGGKPATQRIVWIGLASGQPGPVSHGRTEPDGSYEIEGLPPGEYRVRADEDISRTITIAGDAVLNIDIPSVQLSGRVLEDGSSAPIVGADVYMRGIGPATARVHGYKETNHFGEFSLTGIEPGEIMLIVFLAGYELYQEKISYSSPITKKTIALRKATGVEITIQQAANKEPIRGLMVTETIPGNELAIDLWIPLTRDGIGYLPSALAGSKLAIQGREEKPVIIDEWDGQSLDLKL